MMTFYINNSLVLVYIFIEENHTSLCLYNKQKSFFLLCFLFPFVDVLFYPSEKKMIAFALYNSQCDVCRVIF